MQNSKCKVQTLHSSTQRDEHRRAFQHIASNHVVFAFCILHYPEPSDSGPVFRAYRLERSVAFE